MPDRKRALYFGCLNQRGHFLHSDGPERDSLDSKRDYPGFPWTIGHLDSGLLKNGRVPDKPTGRVYWTCGGRTVLWFAFHWWDRSVDKRGASNSGFYVRGFEIGQEQEAFEYACQVWPKVVARQLHPLMLVVTSPGAEKQKGEEDGEDISGT